MKTYFLTIAKHQVKDHVTKDDLIETVHQLKLRLPQLELHNTVYELSKTYNQLHLHAIAYNRTFIKYKDFNSVNGYSIRWKPVYSLDRVCSYMQKQVTNKYEQDQLLAINDINAQHSFT